MRRAFLAAALWLSGCPDSPPPPTTPGFTVRLVSAGKDPAAVAAAVGSLAQLDPRIARELVERAPVPVLVDVPAAEAERARVALETAGAQVLVGSVPR